MERRTLATLIGATLFVVLLGTVVYIGQNHPPESPASSPVGPAQRAAASSSATARDLAARPLPNETIEHRRQRMMSNKAYRDDFKLSEQDVYMYVREKGSNAVSLVSAFEASRNKDYLKTATEKFPNDPLVQAKALMWLDLSPEERAKMLDAFKASSPSNAFPNLLAARDAMKRGDTPAALAEIAAAKEKSYDEFDRESMQGLEDAYLSTGRGIAESKTLGMAEVTLPQLVQLKALGTEFVDLAAKAAAAGDTKTQQEMLMANWEIGQKIRAAAGVRPIITELVGIAMQNATLRGWSSGADFQGQAATDVIAGNLAARKDLQSSAPAFEKWFPSAPDQEIIDYMDMIKASGERQAMAWLKEQHPELANLQPNN